jgi:hypothetical protein
MATRRAAKERYRKGGWRLMCPVGKKDDEQAQEPNEVGQDLVSLLGVDLRKHRDEIFFFLPGGRRLGLCLLGRLF